MSDYLEQLDRLATLRQKEVISQEEFEAEKARIFAGRAEPAQSSSFSIQGFIRRPSVLAALGVVLIGTLGGYWLLSGMRSTEQVSSLMAKESKTISSPLMLFNLENVRDCRFDDASESLIERIQIASQSPPGDPLRLLTLSQPAKNQAEVRSRSEKDARISEADVSLPWHGSTISRIRVIDWPQGRGVVLVVRGNVEGVNWIDPVMHDKGDNQEQNSDTLEGRAFSYQTGGETRYACFAALNAGA